MLVCCILLNRTQRKQVDQVIGALFRRYPDAKAMADAEPDELRGVIRLLGFEYQRALRLKKFSHDWIALTETLEYLGEVDMQLFMLMLGGCHGVGAYALDSYLMFVFDEWRSATPTDKELRKWKVWRLASDRRDV